MDVKGRARPRNLGLCAVVAALVLGACSGPNPAAGPTDEQLRIALAESLVATGKSLHYDSFAAAATSADHYLQTVYETRNFKPIWVGPGGANERARLLLARLSDASTDALNPERYELDEILDPLAAGDADGLVSAELYFSRALMRYAADLQGVGEDDVAVVAAAGSAVDFGGYLDSLIPRDPAYRRLRAAMRLYRGIEADGGWPAIPVGRTLRRGVTDSRTVLMRQRLGATGDLAAAGARAESELFDDEMEAALRRFQERHGLQVDGIAGTRTLKALNVPVAERIARIAANFGRLRSEAPEIGERALVVNIAAQQLVLIDGGEEILRSRTIVGRVGWETPLLSSQVRSIEVNPTWTVPRKIALQEILPQVRKGGPEYFGNRGYRVFDAKMQQMDATAIEWEKIGDIYMPYTLRQDAGAGNALGRVKFHVPNDQDIYLHDTPGRALFNRAKRAFSHGCVRVERADELAVLLLRIGADWSKADYQQALKSGKTIRIRLDRPMPLHLVSFTVWVEEDGTVQFRNDPYESETSNINKSQPNKINGNFL
jgi:murein L,D-transpeptidase YcbB/YkuD